MNATTEMAERILEFVKGHKNTSFAELVRHLGEPAVGDLSMISARNICLWSGVSQQFCDAYALALKQLDIKPTHVMTYLIDGVTLNMPLAVRPPSGGYKQPHWAPAVLNFAEVTRTRRQEASATAEK